MTKEGDYKEVAHVTWDRNDKKDFWHQCNNRVHKWHGGIHHDGTVAHQDYDSVKENQVPKPKGSIKRKV